MGKQYGFAIDLERCIGCDACTIACKVEHGFESGSGLRVETIGGPRKDTPSGRHPKLHMHYLPIPCMHCEIPPCRDACPSDAIAKREDGLVIIEAEKCNGCLACAEACPYGAIMGVKESSVPIKCDGCLERIEHGVDPFCAVCCETGAIWFGDLGNESSTIVQEIRKRTCLVLKQEAQTRPSVVYFPTKDGGFDKPL
jgi:Fe-S-cluster-containing dehydrogenase component